MKILIVSHDLGIKQYHLAAALKNFGNEIHFMYTAPRYLNATLAKNAFPHPKTLAHLFRNRVNHASVEGNRTYFSSVAALSRRKLEKLCPDKIIISSKSMHETKPEIFRNYYVVFDIEDSTVAINGL